MELSPIQLLKAREALLTNARELLRDSLLLITNGRVPRGYAMAVLYREEVGKLTMTIRVVYALKAGEPVDWRRFHRRTQNHAEKLKVSALLWILLSTSQAGKADPKAELLRLLDGHEYRLVL